MYLVLEVILRYLCCEPPYMNGPFFSKITRKESASHCFFLMLLTLPEIYVYFFVIKNSLDKGSSNVLEGPQKHRKGMVANFLRFM